MREPEQDGASERSSSRKARRRAREWARKRRRGGIIERGEQILSLLFIVSRSLFLKENVEWQTREGRERRRQRSCTLSVSKLWIWQSRSTPDIGSFCLCEMENCRSDAEGPRHKEARGSTQTSFEMDEPEDLPRTLILSTYFLNLCFLISN